MEVADLVEEDGSAMRRLELADLELVGARESTSLVTEQLALQELAGHGGAIDLHERSGPARGKMVDRARDQLLARARLPGDQDGDVDARSLADDLARLQHLRTAPELHLASNSAAKLLGSRPERLGLRPNDLVDRLLELVEAERLVKHCFRLDRHPGKTVVVTVGDSDDGPGIPAAQLQTLH